MRTLPQKDKTKGRQKDIQTCAKENNNNNNKKTQLLTLGTRETPCAGIKQQNPISYHYCFVIRSIWTLALALYHLPQTFPVPNKPASLQLVSDTLYKRAY